MYNHSKFGDLNVAACAEGGKPGSHGYKSRGVL
jgi:hypothetical protein